MKSNFFWGILLSFIALQIICSEKLLIITHAYNRPDFIEIQDKTFKAFLEDDYEFVVFNDARDKQIRTQINNMCRKLKLSCIEIPQAIHDKPYLERRRDEDRNHPCCRCANVVQYSLDVLGFDYPGIVAIVDSDMFLIKKFSIKNYLNGCDLSACPQGRGHEDKVLYLWNGLVFLNMKTLPNKRTMNWNCGIVDGEATDVGGFTHYYLLKNNRLSRKYFPVIHVEKLPKDYNSLRELGFDDVVINHLIMKNPHWMEFHADKHFLHYRAGGNWAQQSPAYHAEKTRLLNEFVDSLLKTENN